MRSNFLIVATLGLALSGPAAWAQSGSGTEAEPAAQAGTEAAAGQPAGQAAEPEADPEAGGYSVASPLAEVNGETLTLGDLITIRRQLPEQYQSIPDEVLMKALTEQMIDQELLAEAARKAQLQDRPAVALKLEAQERAILAEAYLLHEIETRATDEAIEALYLERYVNAEPEDEVRAAHILVETEDLAKELKAELDAGADFATLAAEHGTDGTASRGGELGWFVKSEMVPAFANAAFAMEPGTISDPVETSFGWHLIKLEERRQREAPDLEDVRGALLRQLVEKAQTEVVAELREKATISFADPQPPVQSIRDDAMVDAAE